MGLKNDFSMSALRIFQTPLADKFSRADTALLKNGFWVFHQFRQKRVSPLAELRAYSFSLLLPICKADSRTVHPFRKTFPKDLSLS